MSVFHVPKISWKYSFRLIVISRSKLDLGIYRAPRPAGPSTEGGPGESPPENFWKRGAIWCILGSFQHWIATKIVTFFLCFQVIKKKICKIFVMNIKLISNLFSESTQINMRHSIIISSSSLSNQLERTTDLTHQLPLPPQSQRNNPPSRCRSPINPQASLGRWFQEAQLHWWASELLLLRSQGCQLHTFQWDSQLFWWFPAFSQLL